MPCLLNLHRPIWLENLLLVFIVKRWKMSSMGESAQMPPSSLSQARSSGELDTSLMHPLALLLLIPLRASVELLGRLDNVLGRRKEHAPPLWEVNQSHREGAADDHHPHE